MLIIALYLDCGMKSCSDEHCSW